MILLHNHHIGCSKGLSAIYASARLLLLFKDERNKEVWPSSLLQKQSMLYVKVKSDAQYKECTLKRDQGEVIPLDLVR